jgi:L-iditol 2-dehydrogenase
MAGPSKSMRVWQLVRPGELRLESVDVPEPGDGEVLARVSLALTCGTDLKTVDRGHARLKVPGPLGHEWAGSVAAVGPGVQGLTPGTRIVGMPTAPCGDCAYCLRGAENLCLHLFEHMALGAYGEFILIPRQIVNRHIFRLTSDDSNLRGAFLEPVACVVHGADQLHIAGDRTIAFLGDGPMALIFVQLARLRGAGRIAVIGRHRRRLELAQQFGADVTVDANDGDPLEAVREMSDGLGADSVVECVGRPEAWQDAVSLARRGGEVLFFGGCERGAAVNFDTERVHYDEITLKGGFHYTPDCVRRAGELICSGNLNLEPLVTHEMSLDELPEALELMRRREALKVAIVP